MPRKNGLTKLGKRPTEVYAKAWKQKNPLLSTHVPRSVYEEVKRRALAQHRSISQFLALHLERHFTAIDASKVKTVTIEGDTYPIAIEPIEDD